MALPAFTTAGADLYGRLEPWTGQDQDNGYAVAWLCHGVGLAMQEVYEAGLLGFEQLDDPDTTPAWFLPYLAMRNGVRIPAGLTEAQQRARVRSTDGLRRGTPDAIIGAARQHLTDPVNGHVILLERQDVAGTPEAYHFVVITYTSETPDPSLVEAALLEQKPVGHILHYLTLDGYIVVLFEADYSGQTVADAEGDFSTVYDLETNQP